MQFTNVRAVINRLALDKTQYEEDDIIEWIINGLDILNLKKAYQQEAIWVEVKNHKAILPCDLIQIEMIVTPLTEGDFCDGDEEELADCGYNKDYVNQVNSNYNIKVINNWNRFSNTDYFRRNFQVLKLSNLPFAGKFHCNTCPNISSNCGLTYTLSPNGYITTSFESGHICLAYLKYAKDENDEYIIPDHEDLIQALANWCMAKHWEIRMNMKEEGAFNMYNMYINKAQNLFQKVKGIFITKSFDFQTWKNIVFKDIKWASSYTIFNKSRYTNLGTHSRIKVNI
jgi:hypothetical protein